MESEDFSFPKLTNSTPRFTFSRPLWPASSLVSPSSDDNDKDEDIGRNSSFSCPKTKEEEEDKMDKLWEEFNDKELQRACSKERDNNREGKAEESLTGKDNTNNMVVEDCCVEALKMCKRCTCTGGGIKQDRQQERKKICGCL